VFGHFVEANSSLDIPTNSVKNCAVGTVSSFDRGVLVSAFSRRGVAVAMTIDIQRVPPGIEISEDDLDFGTVWEEDAFSRRLLLRNRTSDSIAIKEFVCSRARVRVEPVSVVLAPGGHTEVTVVADLTTECYEGEREVRPFSCIIAAIEEEGIDPRHKWELKGTIQRVLFAPDRIRFDVPVTPGRPVTSALVTVKVKRPNTRLQIQPENPVCRNVEVVSIDETRQGYTIRLTPDDTLPPGWFESLLEVDAVDDGGRRLFTKWIPIDGRVEGAIRALPDQIILGTVDCGNSVDVWLSVTGKEAGQGFQTVGFDLPDGARMEPIGVDANGQIQRFRLHYEMSRAGYVEESVTIRIITRGVDEKVVIPLFGYGVEQNQ
jgi:hypothetical protein